jgi:cellulose synthase/poly-beta-1,6-N-acetylglucosamine synthase-like glycosyltransferase
MEEMQAEYWVMGVLLSITIAYAWLTLVWWFAWIKIKSVPAATTKHLPIQVSVIIAVRNEEAGILKLLQDLNKQDYPHKLLEVIIIDDHSTDATVSLVSGFAAECTYALHLYKLTDYLQEPLPQNNYKKKAIELAVGMATGKIIVTTDGDCRVGEKWLSAIAHAFADTDMQIISGASLVGSGAATLALGIPTMCNGANLAYRREIFLEVGGYADTAGTASGDDIFLMQKINRAYPGKAFFLKNDQAIVYTKAKEDWGAFVQQRKRWAGKWNMYQDKLVPVLALFIFISNFSILAALILCCLGYYPLSMFLIQIVIKFSVEFVFLTSVLRYLHKQQFIVLIILLQCVYFLYVSFFGLISQKKGYSWKGRNLLQ